MSNELIIKPQEYNPFLEDDGLYQSLSILMGVIGMVLIIFGVFIIVKI